MKTNEICIDAIKNWYNTHSERKIFNRFFYFMQIGFYWIINFWQIISYTIKICYVTVYATEKNLKS